MSFADCMQDLEKTNTCSEVSMKVKGDGFIDSIVKRIIRMTSPRPAVSQNFKN
jgi:hypothetical protein